MKGGKFNWLTKRVLGNYYQALFLPKKKAVIREVDTDRVYDEILYPELLDISITKQCNLECPYCYQSSSARRKEYLSLDDLRWLIDFFGDAKPFQVASGGGEPTLHKDFPEILKLFYDNQIVPNYTTNGYGLIHSEEIRQATEKYAGGVALTYHKHAERLFWEALEILESLANVQKNIHYIVDRNSIYELRAFITQLLNRNIGSIVLLEFQPIGRGKIIELENSVALRRTEYDLIKRIYEEPRSQKLEHKLAFGASLEFLLIEHAVEQGYSLEEMALSLYNPESLFSGYIDEQLRLAPSSYWNGERINLKEYPNFEQAYNSTLMRRIRLKQKSLQSFCKYAVICNGCIHGSCNSLCKFNS